MTWGTSPALIKNMPLGDGEVVQWLRVFGVLPGDWGSIPSTHRLAYNL